jgi:hypothetical protein
MASVRSIDSLLHTEPRELPVRRVLSRLITSWDAIREGGAAAHEYETLVRRGVPHEEAVERVFENHYSRG